MEFILSVLFAFGSCSQELLVSGPKCCPCKLKKVKKVNQGDSSSFRSGQVVSSATAPRPGRPQRKKVYNCVIIFLIKKMLSKTTKSCNQLYKCKYRSFTQKCKPKVTQTVQEALLRQVLLQHPGQSKQAEEQLLPTDHKDAKQTHLFYNSLSLKLMHFRLLP